MLNLGNAKARREAEDLISLVVGSSQAMMPEIHFSVQRKGGRKHNLPLAPWLILMILCTMNSWPVGNR